VASTTVGIIRAAQAAISAASVAITREYLEEWSSLVDHELPTPLMAVLGHLATVREVLDDLHLAIEQSGSMAATTAALEAHRTDLLFRTEPA
jgi:signal transduction histidine kinase